MAEVIQLRKYFIKNLIAELTVSLQRRVMQKKAICVRFTGYGVGDFFLHPCPRNVTSNH